MRQENNINLFPICSVQDINRRSFTDLPPIKYAVPTKNRFTVLSNHPDTLNNELTYTLNQDSTSRDPTKASKYHGKTSNQKELLCRRPTTSSIDYSKDKPNQQVKVINEEAGNCIPTIVNGIISNSSNFESVTENSVVSNEVYSDCINRTIAELRESIKAHMEKDNTPLEQWIILIGDSNIRGYASTLQTLLDTNYKLYSIVKPGSDSDELLKKAKKTIKQLTQKDMTVLCYGANDSNQKSSKESYPNTYQNIKKFITINNYTNILVINIPV